MPTRPGSWSRRPIGVLSLAFLFCSCSQSVGVPGPAGAQGPPGDPGAAGTRGDVGPAGPAGPGSTAYYALQSTAATTVAPMGTWIDIAGVSQSFSTTTGSTVDLLASGSVTTLGPSAICAFRFMINGVPTGDPTNGDRLVTAYANQWSAFTVLRRSPPPALAAGTHSVKMQVARMSADGAECVINVEEYSAAHLYITVR